MVLVLLEIVAFLASIMLVVLGPITKTIKIN